MSMMWQLRHVRASYLVVPVRATLLGGPGTQNMLCFQRYFRAAERPGSGGGGFSTRRNMTQAPRKRKRFDFIAFVF